MFFKPMPDRRRALADSNISVLFARNDSTYNCICAWNTLFRRQKQSVSTAETKCFIGRKFLEHFVPSAADALEHFVSGVADALKQLHVRRLLQL